MSPLSLTRSSLLHTTSPSAGRIIALRGSRSIRSSSVVRADHGHGHAAEAEEPGVYTKESFLNSTWRNTFIFTTLATLAYTFLPTPSSSPNSPTASTSYSSSDASDGSLPWFTRKLQEMTTPASVWSERNEKHLELTIRSAEDRLLFQEAERPKIYRLKYPG